MFPSIEHIDDGPTTAPSKRIIKLIPGYEDRKASAGPNIAEYIGLTVIREKCLAFPRMADPTGRSLEIAELFGVPNDPVLDRLHLDSLFICVYPCSSVVKAVFDDPWFQADEDYPLFDSRIVCFRTSGLSR